MVHKEDKDPTDCGSDRPITLLNVDQKLLSAILADRLTKIVTQIIDPDQTGFIPNRHLPDNVRRTLELFPFQMIHLHYLLNKLDVFLNVMIF